MVFLETIWSTVLCLIKEKKSKNLPSCYLVQDSPQKSTTHNLNKFQ